MQIDGYFLREAVRLRFEPLPTMNTTEGTAQPEWLDQFQKVRTPNHHKVGVHASRGTDSRLVADVPGFEPGFSA